jgi:hypothetical protein
MLKCPQCQSPDIIPIAYGLPSEELLESAQRGEVHLGGCVMFMHPMADQYCKTCEFSWYDINDPRTKSSLEIWGSRPSEEKAEEERSRRQLAEDMIKRSDWAIKLRMELAAQGANYPLHIFTVDSDFIFIESYNDLVGYAPVSDDIIIDELGYRYRIVRPLKVVMIAEEPAMKSGELYELLARHVEKFNVPKERLNEVFRNVSELLKVIRALKAH